MRGYLKQSRQRGESAGCNHVESAREPLDLRVLNGDAVRQAELLGRVTKEIGSEPARLDEGYRPLDEERNDQPRQPGAGSNVQPRCSGTRLEPDELGRIEDVALPNAVQGRSRNEVLPCSSGRQEVDESLDSPECFT